MFKLGDIKWIKNVKRDDGNLWAYLEYHEGAEFYLNWKKKDRRNVNLPANGDMILIFQTVNKTVYDFPGTYLTHLVTPISVAVAQDNKYPRYPWIRKCKVIAYAGLDNLIPNPKNFNLNNRAWGDCREIKSLIRNSGFTETDIQKQIWNLFQLPVKIDSTEINTAATFPLDIELLGYKEGKEREFVRKHKLKERSQQFVNAYKNKYKNIETCPACNCNPNKDYNLTAINFFELHHIIPFAIRQEEYELNEVDVILLCPNCHRAIHKYMSKNKDKKITLNDFKKLLFQLK